MTRSKCCARICENERETVGRLSRAHPPGRVDGEFALSETLRAIIVQEQEHEIDLSAALNINVPPAKSPADKKNGSKPSEKHPCLKECASCMKPSSENNPIHHTQKIKSSDASAHRSSAQ